MPATEGYRPPGERTNHIAPPVRAINKQTIGYMNTDHGMALLPGRADWPSQPAFLDETTVVDHDLLQMLDPLPDGDVLGDVGTCATNQRNCALGNYLKVPCLKY